MKKYYKIFIVTISAILLSSCQHRVCDTWYNDIIVNTWWQVIWTSQETTSHWAEGAMWWAVLWYILGWDNGSMIWAGLWWLAGWWTTSTRNLFTYRFSDWTVAVCSNNSCETPSWDVFTLSWDNLINKVYYVDNCRMEDLF